MLATEVGNVLHSLERRRLERRKSELRTMLAEAERRGNTDMVTQLQTEAVEVNRALRML